ncbi:DNA polymerase [Atopobiaceae bacterium HCP3S3_F7]
MLYHQVAATYQFGSVLPLPAGAKTPPPGGYTGHHGKDPGPDELAAWGNHAGNYALRLPDGVVGIDVDQYGSKNGLATLQAAEAQLGALPDTWMSTGRHPRTGSGIRFYRYPGGRLAGVLGESVEVIQRGHRYAVVWPSVAHGSDGTTLEYRWYKWVPEVGGIPAGWAGMNRPPRVEELAELPPAWVAHLQAGAAADIGPAASASDTNKLLSDIVTDDRPICGAMKTALGVALSKLSGAGAGGRHDAATAGALLIVSTAAEGHSGFSVALAEFEAAWHEAIGHDPSRAGEFERMVSTAVGKAAAKHPGQTDPVGGHLCERPGDTGTWVTDAVEGVYVPVLPTIPDVFDPAGAGTDLELAVAVAQAIHPAYRWAHDAQGWLVRDDKNHVWRSEPGNGASGAKAAVTRMAAICPPGDPAAPDGSDAKYQAARRKRLQSNAGNGAVASMLLSSAPSLPWLRADTASLDADPNILWAGGVPWDLAASKPRLTPRLDIDPNTPHLATAAAYPADIATPLWDTFMAAAFPDPEQRAWVMRLFGVATTGHADAALPILYGPPGAGKTSAVKLVGEALGSYAVYPSALILDNTTNTTEERALLGKRLAFVDEGPRTNRLALEKLKALTGGASMQGRELYKNNVTWRPTHTLFMTSNEYPQVADGGLRRRVRAVESAGDIEAVRAAMLAIVGSPERWKAELPGVVARLIHEAAAYLEDRTTADNPLGVQADLEALAREQDPLLAWMDERVKPGGPTKSMDLWDDFTAYATRMGVKWSGLPSLHTWGRRLTAMGYPAEHTRTGKVRALEVIHGGGFAMGPWAPPAGVEAAPEQAPEGPENGGVTLSEGTSGAEPENLSYSQDTFDSSRVPAQGVTLLAQNGDPSVTLPAAEGSHTNPVVKPASGTRVTLVTLSTPKESDNQEEVISNRTRALNKEFTNHPPKGHTAPETDPAAGVSLPAVMQRGGQPFTVALDDARALLSTLAGQRVTLDVETSGYPVGHRDYRPKTIQLGTRDYAVVLDAADPDHVALATDVLDAASEIQAHSATADVSLVALAAGRDSAPWWDKTTDTAVLAALAPADLTGLHKNPKALGLKALSAKLLEAPVAPEADKARAAHFRATKWLTNPDVTTPPERNGWHEVDPGHPVMVTYAASDVLDTDDVRTRLPNPPATLMARERRLQGVLARLPERGLRLDAERVAELKAHHEAERDKWADALKAHGVDDPGSNTELGQAFIALGADLPATATGKPSTAAATIERLAEHDGPARQLAQDLLAYREHAKLLGTYLVPFSLQCTHGDGRARPTILTLGAAATGRMSSVRPNIQQVPRDGGMRAMFVADDGHAFIAADFSSVEVRIAAAITGDATLAHMVREGIDLHGEVVKLAWGLSPEDPDFKAVRYDAKRAVFGYLYGAGLTTMAKQLGAHGDKAQAVVDALKAITPQLIDYDRGLRRAVETGKLTRWVHPSGRTSWFNADQPHKSLNMVVQGYGRELLVDAMFRWEAMHPGHTIIPIHDEMVIQVDAEHADQYAEDLVACMTTTLEPSIPIVAEADAPTTRWGSVES